MVKLIYIGADHAGFELKEAIKPLLVEMGYRVEDKGAFKMDREDDYPDFIIPVAKAVAIDPKQNRGIVIGGSGQGEAIAANRLKGVRAVVFNGQYKRADGEESPDEIKVSREHNNSNILSLGARFIEKSVAIEAVKKWLTTDFLNEDRHERRLAKIDQNT